MKQGNMRPLIELAGESGMLWLINRVVFHPRGLALALHVDDGKVVGWGLNDGEGEPFVFSEESDDRGFLRAEKTIKEARTTKDEAS